MLTEMANYARTCASTIVNLPKPLFSRLPPPPHPPKKSAPFGWISPCRRIQKFPLWRADLKISGFACEFVGWVWDDSLIQKEKVADSKIETFRSDYEYDYEYDFFISGVMRMRIDCDTVTQRHTNLQSRSQDFVDNEIVAKSRRLDYEFFSRPFKVSFFVHKMVLLR